MCIEPIRIFDRHYSSESEQLLIVHADMQSVT